MAEAVRVLIAGAGGHGQVIADVLMAAERQGAAVRVVGFLDDNALLRGATRLGLPILGAMADVAAVAHDAVVIGIGDNAIRRGLFERLRAGGARFVTALHPSAVIAQDVEIGDGTVACASVTVNPGARIGVNVILNTGCIVEHHCYVGDHAHIAPGVRMGGEVQIGEGCLVGIGAVILPGIRIGRECIIGGGAVVTADVPDGVVVVGVPARVLYASARAGMAGQG